MCFTTPINTERHMGENKMSAVLQTPSCLTQQALAPTVEKFAAARADIAACALTDALIDAEDAHAELQNRFTDLRAMKPAMAALLFGSEAAWRQALARVGVAAGRQLSAVEALRIRLRQTPDFALSEVESRTTRGWTGD
jgi:hypothetical protein